MNDATQSALPPSLVIFVYAKAAKFALGVKQPKPGLGPLLAGVPTFQLTGPFAAKAETHANLSQLLRRLAK